MKTSKKATGQILTALKRFTLNNLSMLLASILVVAQKFFQTVGHQ